MDNPYHPQLFLTLPECTQNTAHLSWHSACWDALGEALFTLGLAVVRLPNPDPTVPGRSIRLSRVPVVEADLGPSEAILPV